MYESWDLSSPFTKNGIMFWLNVVLLCIFMLFCFLQGQNKLIILLFDPVEANDNILINIDKNGEKIVVQSYKKRNPYTLQFPVPGKS